MARRIVTILILLLPLAGCTNSGVAREPDARQLMVERLSAGQKSGCINLNTVDSWRVVNRNALVVYAPSIRRPWLVTIRPSCHTLNTAEHILIKGRSNRVCGYAGEAVYADDFPCSIHSIVPITPEQARELTSKQGPSQPGS